MNLLPFIILCFLYFYAFIVFYIAIIAKKNGERSAFINNLANSLVLIASISINLKIITLLNLQNSDFLVFPYDVFMLCFILFFLPVFYLLTVNEKRKVKKNPAPSNKIESRKSKELPLRYDIYRKSTHLVVLMIIFFYFSIFFFEGNIMLFNQNLVIFLVGISLIGLLTADFVRILKPEYYPLKPVNRILREKELHMRVGSHISMAVGCFSTILLYGLFHPFGPLCICTSITMTIFGDISSNLVGRTIGKNQIRDTNKTYEGLLAGIISTIVSGMIILSLLKDYYFISPLGFLVLPLSGSLIFGIIDYLDLEIDDNLTYTLIISSILFFISIVIA